MTQTSPMATREQKKAAAEAARLARLAARAQRALTKAQAARTKSEINLIYAVRQTRDAHPEGKFDRRGRWYPSARERSSSLCGIRQPSAAWPYSLMKACRTRRHVTALEAEAPKFFAELLHDAVGIAARSHMRARDAGGESVFAAQFAAYVATHPELVIEAINQDLRIAAAALVGTAEDALATSLTLPRRLAVMTLAAAS